MAAHPANVAAVAAVGEGVVEAALDSIVQVHVHNID